jgi:hypothetical protein
MLGAFAALVMAGVIVCGALPQRPVKAASFVHKLPSACGGIVKDHCDLVGIRPAIPSVINTQAQNEFDLSDSNIRQFVEIELSGVDRVSPIITGSKKPVVPKPLAHVYPSITHGFVDDLIASGKSNALRWYLAEVLDFERHNALSVEGGWEREQIIVVCDRHIRTKLRCGHLFGFSEAFDREIGRPFALSSGVSGVDSGGYGSAERQKTADCLKPPCPKYLAGDIRLRLSGVGGPSLLYKVGCVLAIFFGFLGAGVGFAKAFPRARNGREGRWLAFAAAGGVLAVSGARFAVIG